MIFMSEAKLFYIDSKRYSFETVISIIVFVIIFCGSFVGLAKAIEGVNQLSMAVGYLSYIIVSSVVNSSVKTVGDHLKYGLIEVIYATSRSYLKLLHTQLAVRFIYDMFLALLLALVMTTFVDFSAVSLMGFFSSLFIVFSAIPSAVGLGLILNALQIRFKKTEILIVISLVVIITLVSLDFHNSWILAFLPFVMPVSLAKLAITGQSVAIHLVALTILQSVVYWVIGWFVYQKVLKNVKHLGILGHA